MMKGKLREVTKISQGSLGNWTSLASTQSSWVQVSPPWELSEDNTFPPTILSSAYIKRTEK